MYSVCDNWADYKETGAEAAGISTDSVESRNSFSDDNNFPFPLLPDEQNKVIDLYDVKSRLPNRTARGCGHKQKWKSRLSKNAARSV